MIPMAPALEWKQFKFQSCCLFNVLHCLHFIIKLAGLSLFNPFEFRMNLRFCPDMCVATKIARYQHFCQQIISEFDVVNFKITIIIIIVGFLFYGSTI